MKLARDLLEQARHLARREPRRPRQASLRRAVSATYYSLFHLLVDEASRAIATGPSLEGVRHLTSRALGHAEMRDASRSFAGGTLPQHVDSALGSPTVPRELRSVADAFQELQQARHEADYDLSRRFTRRETIILIEQARSAARSWSAIRSSPIARAYLHSLFAWNKWRK